MNKINKQLNQLLADSHVMYTKVHNYHWNVKGPYFDVIHKKTEEIYGYFSVLYDTLAERILQRGDTPYVTLKQIHAAAQLPETDSTSFTGEEVIQSLLKDYDYFLKEFRNLSQGLEGDQATTALTDEVLAQLEKEQWMLKATLG